MPSRKQKLNTVKSISLANIVAGQHNVRRKLHHIDELAASLERYGLLQPIVVRQDGDLFQVVAGHRRLEAARQLGWTTIPAILRTEGEDDSYLVTLIENLQREDLSAREEAAALAVLVRDRGWSTRDVAAAIHRSQAFVSKRLRVFEDPMLAPAVLAGRLSVSAAEELLTAPERRRYDLLARAIDSGWDSTQIRRAIKAEASPADRRRPRGMARHVRHLRDELRDLRPEDLTDTDRRELALLFKELAMLARARVGAARVFPSLPSTRNSSTRKTYAPRTTER